MVKTKDVCLEKITSRLRTRFRVRFTQQKPKLTATSHKHLVTILAKLDEFIKLRPFPEGNGLIFRLVLNVLLLKYGGMLVSFYEGDGETYLEFVTMATPEYKLDDWAPVRGKNQALSDDYGKHASSTLKRELANVILWLMSEDEEARIEDQMEAETNKREEIKKSLPSGWHVGISGAYFIDHHTDPAEDVEPSHHDFNGGAAK